MSFASSSLLILIGMGVVSFAICGIPFGLVFAKLFCNTDIRAYGSGNIGMTNVARTCGKALAAATFICDAGKGLLCLSISRMLMRALALTSPESFAYFCDARFIAIAIAWLYLVCVFGHIFSPFLKGKGGKGISVGFGAGLAIDPIMALSALAFFFVLTFVTKRVSVGSLGACVALPLAAYLRGCSQAQVVPIVLVALTVIWAHRTNILRLVRGEEPVFSVHRSASPRPKGN